MAAHIMAETACRARPKRRGLSYLFDLLVVLVDRDMKLLYKRSALGVLWTLINPLFQLLVFLFIFRVVVRVDIAHYPSYVFTALLVWQWFQGSLVQAAGAIINSRPLIRQPGFPVSILPQVVVTTGWVHLMLALPILFGFLIFDGVTIGLNALWIPVIQLIQFLLQVSLAYVVAGLNVSFRDTGHLLKVLLQLMFYLTPVFYDAARVPAEYQSLYRLNPMVHIVNAYRSLLIQGEPPDWHALAIVAACALVLLPIGYRLFVRQSHRFVEEL
ncbi:ABC transporter permease [Methylotetracoccus oryzae]|uniref:ABC transporter permease n=1 Tax=Methylotetracoccus oryzae TaxID=1919059 RepID=UPI00191371FD|nr:ABC transporter permease [Methylotetracoccus oryzae]